MARIVFIAIAFYLLYRLIFDLILPVYKTTKHIKKQFNNMQEQTHQNNGRQETSNNNHNSSRTDSKVKVGEYIEFEETKN